MLLGKYSQLSRMIFVKKYCWRTGYCAWMYTCDDYTSYI